MLKRSFIMIPGIGERTEMNLWKYGIDSWERFVEKDHLPGMGPSRKRTADEMLDSASRSLRRGDLGFFSDLFKPRDTWRYWSEFGDGARFLDIETLGTRRNSPITVVGVHNGEKFDAAVRGFNLDGDKIRDMMKGAKMIVTFNGTTFDLPMIREQYPGSLPEVPHMDLRFVARRIGLTGGLKSIELSTGIKRPKDVAGMSGEDAVRLWRLFENGHNRNVLKLILKYNREDIINLIPLAERIVGELEKRTESMINRERLQCI
jgi:uncharacterized protein YprB with RNaseH-like and TPR domain